MELEQQDENVATQAKHWIPFENNEIKKPGNTFANGGGGAAKDLTYGGDLASLANTEMKEKKATAIIACLLSPTEYSQSKSKCNADSKRESNNNMELREL